jgi:hypothetical protein
LLKDVALKAGLDFVVESVEDVVEYESEEDSDVNRGVRFGVRAGFNMYQYSEHDFHPGFGMGGGAGLAVKFPFSSSLSISSELAFYYRHLYNNDDYNTEDYVYEYVISVPILLQLALTKSFHLAAGAYLDIPIVAKNEYIDLDRIGIPIQGSRDVTEFRKMCDFGLAFGLEYMITPNLGVDLRGIIGLTSLFEYYGNEYGSLNQYGLGVTYYFYQGN